MPMNFYSRIIINLLTFQDVIFLYPEWKLFLYNYKQIYITKR